MKTIIFILISILFIGCTKEHDYSYQVTGTGGPFSITYVNSTNGLQQTNGWSGWSYKWSEKKSKRYRSISAQCTKTGSVSVKIYRDGYVIKDATSNGSYVIATCYIP